MAQGSWIGTEGRQHSIMKWESSGLLKLLGSIRLYAIGGAAGNAYPLVIHHDTGRKSVGKSNLRVFET